MPTRVLDLFAGAGGLAEGFRHVLGRGGEPAYECVGAVDNWQAACDTFAANHGVRPVCDGVSASSVRKALDGRPAPDLIVGGPPCQGFSTSGKRALEDPRNQLVLAFLDAVRMLQPSAFLMENVEGFTTFQQGQLFEEVLEFAEKSCKYKVTAGLVLASLYGVPQRRRRFVLVGVREGTFKFPEPCVPRAPSRRSGQGVLHLVGDALPSRRGLAIDQEPGGYSELTFGEAVGDLPDVRAGEGADSYASAAQNAYQAARRRGVVGGLTEHVAPRHSAKMISLMKHIPQGASALSPEVAKDIPVMLRPTSGFPNSYARIRWDRPAPTITRNFTTPSSANCIHPRQDRALTLREGARCQSFGDAYRFVGNFGDKRLLIGNAVPPMLAEALARALLPHVE